MCRLCAFQGRGLVSEDHLASSSAVKLMFLNWIIALLPMGLFFPPLLSVETATSKNYRRQDPTCFAPKQLPNICSFPSSQKLQYRFELNPICTISSNGILIFFRHFRKFGFVAPESKHHLRDTLNGKMLPSLNVYGKLLRTGPSLWLVLHVFFSCMQAHEWNGRLPPEPCGKR